MLGVEAETFPSQTLTEKDHARMPTWFFRLKVPRYFVTHATKWGWMLARWGKKQINSAFFDICMFT